MVEFRMPSLGADMESGFLREWRVKPGDHVNRGDIIAEVETQKGIIEIEVFDEGIVGELLIRVDEKVPVGTLMTHILTEKSEKVGVIPPTIEEKRGVEALATTGLDKIIQPVPTAHHVRASPLAKKIAAAEGIDISTIEGSGPDGAITREDVEKAIVQKTSLPGAEKPFAENIRQAVAAAMSKSNREIPHYYLQTKVNISPALNWLTEANKRRSVKDRLLLVALLMKGVARALQDVPDLNAWWENGFQRKKDIHIGFVVSLRTGGVIVPAIHNVEKKSLDEIMKALSDIIPRARAFKLRSSELADSTITVTNLGETAVDTVYGVIYPPQVAIIGFGGVTEQPWAENGMLGVRHVITISLSGDHRATDGNTGNQFLLALKKYLSQPDEL